MDLFLFRVKDNRFRGKSRNNRNSNNTKESLRELKQKAIQNQALPSEPQVFTSDCFENRQEFLIPNIASDERLTFKNLNQNFNTNENASKYDPVVISEDWYKDPDQSKDKIDSRRPSDQFSDTLIIPTTSNDFVKDRIYKNVTNFAEMPEHKRTSSTNIVLENEEK